MKKKNQATIVNEAVNEKMREKEDIQKKFDFDLLIHQRANSGET